MTIIGANDKRYVVKKYFPINKVKDVELLKEIKGFWGADCLITGRGQYWLCETIQEANVVEECTNETSLIHIG